MVLVLIFGIMKINIYQFNALSDSGKAQTALGPYIDDIDLEDV
jgi:hypothetical protein